MADNKIDLELMKAAVKAVADDLLPAAIAAATLAAKPEAPRPQLQAPAPSREICYQCGQALRTGCFGKHAEMVVFPQRHPEHGDFFQGVILNGVRYLSNDESHKVLVPENAVSNISQIVQAFEQNEQEVRIGRKAERYSGRVSPSGSSVTPQTQGWR